MPNTRRLTTPRDDLREQFSSLRDAYDVAALLEVSYSTITYYLYRRPEDLRYTTFVIPKKSGQDRILAAPLDGLKLIQQKLLQVFQAVYRRKVCTYGFVEGRSIVDNASQHCRSQLVLNIDLKDFFPSINFGRVRGLLMAWPYNARPEVATVLAQICCWRGSLPQGAPTSPIVSNMICARLDSDLRRLAENTRSRCTRYADDITFSTNMRRFAPEVVTRLPEGEWQVEAGAELRRIIEGNGFAINDRKTRLRGRFKRQEVTGLTVNQHVNTSRRFVRQIRAMINDWRRNGYDAAQANYHNRWGNHTHRSPDRDDPSFLRVLYGKLEFLKMVKGKHDTVYANLVERARPLNESFRQLPIVHDALWILESEEGYQGTAFTLEDYGLVSCAHVLGQDTVAFKWDNHQHTYPVQVIAADRDLDVSILAIDYTRPVPLARADTRRLRQNDSVTLLGFPRWNYGQGVQVSPGVVTGFRPRGVIEMVSITPQVIKGNSGGPVLNERGEVIGIAVTGADRDPPDFENGVVLVTALDLLLERARATGIHIPPDIGPRSNSGDTESSA